MRDIAETSKTGDEPEAPAVRAFQRSALADFPKDSGHTVTRGVHECHSSGCVQALVSYEAAQWRR